MQRLVVTDEGAAVEFFTKYINWLILPPRGAEALIFKAVARMIGQAAQGWHKKAQGQHKK